MPSKRNLEHISTNECNYNPNCLLIMQSEAIHEVSKSVVVTIVYDNYF